MSEVKNPKYFEHMSSFSVQSRKHSKIHFLGVYDPACMIKCDDPTHIQCINPTHIKNIDPTHIQFIRKDVYLGGKWTGHPWWGGRPIVGKDSLNCRPCVYLYFKHYPFGNNCISKKISKGHWHTNCIVSCNDISIIDGMRVDESKNIIFSGKLRDEMPIIDKRKEHSLFVIEAEEKSFKR